MPNGMPPGHIPKLKGGAHVVLIRDAQTRNIKAARFYGALNLDSGAQPCTVTFYQSPMPNPGSVIAVGNKLAATGAAQSVCNMPPQGVELAEGVLCWSVDVQPTGAGIAVYFEPAD